MYVEVLVDLPHQALDRVFDYKVPKALRAYISKGQRVEVPFQTRTRSGFVLALKKESEVKGVKPLKGILDDPPFFDEERLALSESLSHEHVYPHVAYLHAMLPRALSVRYKRVFRLKDASRLDESLSSLFETGKAVPAEKLSDHMPQVRRAVKEGALEESVRLSQAERARMVEFVRFLREPSSPLGQKQKALLELLKSVDGPMEKARLLKEVGAARASLNRLEERGLIEIFSRETYREQRMLYALEDKDVTLNDEQREAYLAVERTLGTHGAFLLHGVASSGKTEIYIKLSEAALQRGETALVLLPEISLTPKITARFKARFPNRVAVYHSGLSAGEQYDEWRKIFRGEADVVIGARSAVFAPLRDIGFIAIDEEQSDSYIQEDAPAYDARAVARRRASYHDAPLVLGSATPSIVSYYKAREGKYKLLTLKQRALKSVSPRIDIVDMKAAFHSGNRSMFSETLRKGIESRLSNHEQTLILMNRRGHARFVLCRQCGHVEKCEDCDISLTFHKHTSRLMCHHCGKKRAVPKQCPSCGSPHIRYMGAGSERVEEALRETFPQANIVRMDKDTTGRKQAHEKLLHQFEREGDILIGTQMIAKGLDFDNVTLVGVLSADMALHVPDFYAQSETFSLLMQIAGRSGRRSTRGDVVIQTYQKDHPVFQAVAEGDYEAFYEREIDFRRQTNVEPFKNLTQLLVLHEHSAYAHQLALKARRFLQKRLYKPLGPTRPTFPHQHGMHRQQLILRHDGEAEVYKALNELSGLFDMRTSKLVVNHYPRVF